MREARDEPLADADFRPAGCWALTRNHLHVRPHHPRLIAHAADDDVGELRRIERLAERDQDVHLGRNQRPPVRARGDVRRGGDHTRDIAAEAARELGIGAAAQDDDVGARAGLRQCGRETIREREHADEHGDDERDTQRRERRGIRALHDAADIVNERNSHSTCRSAWTMGRRAARNAGTRPLASINPTATATPRISVAVVTLNPGRKPAALKLVAL